MSNHYEDENLQKVRQHLAEAGEGLLSWLDENSTEEMKRSFYSESAELAESIAHTALEVQDFLLGKLEDLDQPTPPTTEPARSTEDPFQELHDAIRQETDSEFEKLIRNAIHQEEKNNTRSGLRQFENDIQDSAEETSLPDVSSWWGRVDSSRDEDTRTPLEKAKDVSTVFSRAGLSTVTMRTGLNSYAIYTSVDNNSRSVLYVTDKTTKKDIDRGTDEIISLLRPHGLSTEERQSILDKMQKVLVKIRNENPLSGLRPRFTFPQDETYGQVSWYNRDSEIVKHEIYLSTDDEDIDEIVEQYFIQE